MSSEQADIEDLAETEEAREGSQSRGELPIDLIAPHANNPRLHFPQSEMERLMESIDEQGVLVPVLVYPNGDGTFTLVDGERRWRSARELGHRTIPAIITEPQSDRDHLIQMFNIHLVREPWNNMPTAWALKRLILEEGTDDEVELHRLTGLEKDQIRRLKHAIDLPEDYQKYIDEGRIPLNFFWELKKHVIDPLAKRRPALWSEFDDNQVLDAFVDKRLAGTLTDTVSLRKVAPIIRVAADEAGSPEDPSLLDDTIRELIGNVELTIDEAYEDSVEIVVEVDKLEKKAVRFIKSFERLWARADTDDDKRALRGIAQGLAQSLNEVVDG